MELSLEQIDNMFDLSCVRMHNTLDDINKLVETAKKYQCGHVSVLQCALDYTRELLGNDTDIKLIGNISFPSGSDSTELKIIQAGQMIDRCDEIDMVMNICWLKSNMFEQAAEDVFAVKKIVKDIPLKVIIESALLEPKQIEQACKICIEAGASFVKSGTGWTSPTTIEQIEMIKSIVGDKIKIKASGGVRNLDMLTAMYKAGATRFGVNLNTGMRIIEECLARDGRMA